jgi:hypothetical protein
MRQQLLVNGALLALALGTLGVVWATREAPTTGELSSRKNKLLPSFRKDAVTRLVLSQDGRELVLEASTPGEFRIVKPWPERADVATVNQLLGSLDLASALRPAPGVSDPTAGLAGSALRIRVEMAEKSLSIRLGGPAPAPTGARYAAVGSDDQWQYYVVSQGVATELTVPFDKFREPRLLEHGRSEFASITLGQGVAKVQLDLGQHGISFTLPSGQHELASHEVTDRILTALSRLATEQFVEVDEARKALSAGAQQVGLTLTDKAAPAITLSLASSCPKDPAQALLLLEQPGKSPRAGCIPPEVAQGLHVNVDELRWSGPFAARTDEVEELRITRGSQKLELARKDKAFVLRAASNAEVPLDAGNARISAIVEAKGERPATNDLAELGLAPGAGELSIRIAGGDATAHRSEVVTVGKPRRDGSVCVKRGDAVVLCFDAEAARAFEPDASLLKGLNIFSFAPSDLASFSVEGPGLHQTVRRNDDGGYQLEEPKGFKHDGSLVADAVQTLGTLQAVRWVAPGDDASLGLAPPRLHVSVTLAAGAGVRSLDIGGATAGGFFARASSDPGVFVVARSVFEALSAPLIERTLVPVPEAELVSIQLETGGHVVTAARSAERWQGLLKGEAVEAILSLKAEQTVHLGAAKAHEGFVKPSLTLRFTAKNGQQYRLLVGARDTLDDSPIAYARLDGVDATFALSERTATMLRDSAHLD